MLLSYNELVELVETGAIDAPIENINGASIDVTLGADLLLEMHTLPQDVPGVDLAVKENMRTVCHHMGDNGYMMDPGQFLLGHTQETFNLPNNIACEYKLKSSLARNGLNHMLAGWADPSWFGSQLTLELHNVLSTHGLILRTGMKIGQMIFWKCGEVPTEHNYATKGQYNNTTSVTASKGVR